MRIIPAVLTCLVASAIVGIADSNTEKALRAENAELRQQLAAKDSQADAVRKDTLKQVSAQTKANKDAVQQAQDESTATASVVASISAAQVEYEKQLVVLQHDLHSLVIALRNATVLLIISVLIVLSFTGVIVYSARSIRASRIVLRKDDDALDE